MSKIKTVKQIINITVNEFDEIRSIQKSESDFYTEDDEWGIKSLVLNETYVKVSDIKDAIRQAGEESGVTGAWQLVLEDLLFKEVKNE